jgi:hypothetical protein
MISPNKIIGSLVYRTREALNNNQKFLDGIASFEFANLIATGGKVHLWHYPGTYEEISEMFLSANDLESCKLKFPALFNYQSVREDVGIRDGLRRLHYNLVFIAPVNPVWTTQTREDKVWKLLLYPIYEEFFRQIKRSGHFQVPAGEIPHTLYRIPTTGASASGAMVKRYSEYMDAFQISDLQLSVAIRNCERDLAKITEENNKVINLN